MELDQKEMPFLESLIKEKSEGPTCYHMPGHKRSENIPPLLTEYFGGQLQSADLVEINNSIDYLHSPKGALLQSQQLTAAAYGVDYTYFLINGSTVGNLAAIMSVVGPGEKILIPRASHRSVYGGIVLSGAIPIYIEPEYHPQIGFPLAVNVKTIERLLNEHKDIVAIHITSPNYYGIMSNIEQICHLAHSRGIVVIVDEAHGAHLKFHSKFPQSSINSKVDIIVHSTHKTLSALTQSAMLHVIDNELINRQRLEQVLSLLQSSSPSSILLASLDAARMQIATQGYQYLSKVLYLSQQARQSIQQIDGLWCYGDDLIGVNHIFDYDPSKLIVRVSDLGLTGYQSSSILRNQYQIEVEFSALKHIVFSITIADTEATIEKLIQGLRSLTSHKSSIQFKDDAFIEPPIGLPSIAINLRDAYFSKRTRRIPMNEAVGYILSENIIPYPPGVPLLVPGEIIEQNHLDYLKHFVENGGSIVGLQDLSFQTIRIIDHDQSNEFDISKTIQKHTRKCMIIFVCCLSFCLSRLLKLL